MVNKARAGKKNPGTNHIVPSWRGPHVTGDGTSHHPRLRRQRASAHTSTASSPPALSFSATTSTPISATPPQLTKKGNQLETPPQAPPPSPPRRRDKTEPRTTKPTAADPRRRRDLHAQSPNDEEALICITACEAARLEQDRGCGEEVAP